MKKLLYLIAVLLTSTLLFCGCAQALTPVVTPEVSYTASGSTSSYSFLFRVWDEGDLVVTVDEVIQLIGSGYTVTGVGDPAGGSVDFVVPPAASSVVNILRQTPLARSTDYSTGGRLSAATLNSDVDKVVTQLQDVGHTQSRHKAILDRALKFPKGDLTSSVLPSVADRQSRYLAFDAAGAPIATGLTSIGSYVVSKSPVADALAQYGAAGDIQATNIFGKVDSLATLRASAGSSGKYSIILEGRDIRGDGGQGVFVWDASDLSSKTSIDPQGAIYVAPNSDLTGTSGAWVRQFSGPIDPRWFGAVGDCVGYVGTDNSPAFKSLFSFIEAVAVPYSIEVQAQRYYFATTVDLPRSISGGNFFRISGYGAELVTDQAITIFRRMPADSTEASSIISDAIPVVEGFTFIGDNTVGQVGMELGATYTARVANNHFVSLARGLIITFGLLADIHNNRFTNCSYQPIVIRSGGDDGDGGGPAWTGATVANSASNGTHVNGARVYAMTGAKASYTILGSDQVTLSHCISEGVQDSIDVRFDYQGSSVVNAFKINNFWAESASSKVNFSIRGKGIITIDTVDRTYPGAFLDPSGSSSGCLYKISHISYWSNMPAGADPDNPNGRWFYHTNGGGYGGTEAGNSTGCAFQIIDSGVSTGFIDNLTDPANWEGGVLPYSLLVENFLGANGGHKVAGTAGTNFSGGAFVVETSTNSDAILGGGRKTYIRSGNGDIYIEPNTTSNGLIIKGRIKAFGSAAATTLGSVQNRLPIYSDTGTFLGYVALYDIIN